MSSLLRTFIAVEIEDREVLSKIIKIKNLLASLSGDSIKPVEDENIHLTLRFLGEIDPSTVEIVKKILGEARSFQRFHMHVRGIGGFPNISRPRVIWVGVERGREDLLRIRRFIDERLSGLRVHVDQHEFEPHITIARVRDKLPQRASQILIDYANEDFGLSPVTKIVLKKSVLTPRGPVYSDLYSIDLS